LDPLVMNVAKHDGRTVMPAEVLLSAPQVEEWVLLWQRKTLPETDKP